MANPPQPHGPSAGQWPQHAPGPQAPGPQPYGPPPPPGHPGGPPPRRRSSAVPWIIGGVVLALVVLIGGGGAAAYFLFLRQPAAGQPGTAPPEAYAEPGDIDGVQTFAGLSADHTDAPVDYPQHPPVGGPHAGEWLNCGVYDDEVPAENAVHSLEHGAVWISHDPGLPDADLERLHGLYTPGSYLVISPVADLPGPVVLSAWGKQLVLESAEDPRIPEFLSTYEQGEQTPEPGAPCSGMDEPMTV
ncbi:DUF3105 domain-containing protein [Nocardiopsis sediminis]|uniref:DUF3105 domain-containing protein n=1 Tax=Nocardiopsis sediminis TaxID=1778267 RepID=A0ABV8FEJ3_9ACTN